MPSIALSRASMPAPVSADISTFGVCGDRSWTSTTTGRSVLLMTTMAGLSAIRSTICQSSAVSGTLPSTTSKARSACANAARLRSTPMSSARSRVSLRMPAVSTSTRGMPFRFSVSSSVSRVVPGMGVTMARSARNRALSRLLLPTLGWPTMAVRMPWR